MINNRKSPSAAGTAKRENCIKKKAESEEEYEPIFQRYEQAEPYAYA